MLSHKKGVFSVCFAIVCILLFFGIVGGQSSGFQVKIDQVSINKFPTVELILSVLNSQGFPVTTLSSDEVILKDDGKIVDNVEFTSLSNDAEPLAIVFLIDTSGSMKASNTQDPLSDAVKAASGLISQLNPDDQVAVISFSDDVSVLQDLTVDKSQIIPKLQNLKAEGATAMNDAVVQALNLLNNRSERRAILLITDGRPEGDQDYNFDTALSLAAARLIPIYPIGFGDVDQLQLKKLAEVSGGIEQIKPNSQELSDAFDSILALFRQQYLLTYQSSAQADDTYHEIEVAVKYQGESQSDFINYQARTPIKLGIGQLTNGSVVRDQVEVQLTIDALNPIAQVDVYIDDQLINTFTEPPFAFVWDTNEYSAGDHIVRVVARDQLGFEKEETYNFAVELEQKQWLYWLIGLAVLAIMVITIPLVLKKRGKNSSVLVQKAVLYESDGLQPGHEWPLDKNIIRLGRKLADNDIRLKGIDASRNHAVIERSKRGFCIRSQKPENPVLVNGEKVDQRILQNGDLIQMGESFFRFENRK